MTDEKAVASAVAVYRLFLSYSWSSPQHERWVLDLATRLRQDGVDAILDKWDLKPGHDSNQFMEQMVTDPTVTKVLLICDEKYAEKANSRKGGVGTESQIISPELYGKGQQSKFAAAITELDDDGQPYLPVYYKGRIYFDFSAEAHFESAYEELLRWVLDRPSNVKPDLGQVPGHIAAEPGEVPRTTSSFRRADDAIRQGTSSAKGSLREFSERVVESLEGFRIADIEGEQHDDIVVAAIQNARPLVSQILAIVGAVARYDHEGRLFDEVETLVEQIGRFMYRPEQLTRWSDWHFDAYKFVAHEVLLASIALLIRERRLDLALRLVTRTYYLERTHGGGASTQDFTAFRPYLSSLDEVRNSRLSLNRVSVHADMLSEFYSNHVPSFEEVMQADLLLYLRYSFVGARAYENWYPITLVYAGRRWSPFEIFARAESKAYFQRLAPLLGVQNADDFKAKMQALLQRQQELPRSGVGRVPVGTLANLDHVATVD